MLSQESGRSHVYCYLLLYLVLASPVPYGICRICTYLHLEWKSVTDNEKIIRISKKCDVHATPARSLCCPDLGDSSHITCDITMTAIHSKRKNCKKRIVNMRNLKDLGDSSHITCDITMTAIHSKRKNCKRRIVNMRNLKDTL